MVGSRAEKSLMLVRHKKKKEEKMENLIWRKLGQN